MPPFLEVFGADWRRGALRSWVNLWVAGFLRLLRLNVLGRCKSFPLKANISSSIAKNVKSG